MKLIATLTQPNGAIQTEGALQAFSKYYILKYEEGDDFLNVGADANGSQVEFVATDNTPANWSHGSQLQKVEDIQLNILENDTGEVSISRASRGVYLLNGTFPVNKTFLRANVDDGAIGEPPAFFAFFTFYTATQVVLEVRDIKGDQTDLNGSTIYFEVMVYS